MPQFAQVQNLNQYCRQALTFDPCFCRVSARQPHQNVLPSAIPPIAAISFVRDHINCCTHGSQKI